jgi:hypothetical protein
MKYKILFTIYVLFQFGAIYSQSIFSALRHDEKLELRDNIVVSEITTEIIFYNENNIEKKKEITTLNLKNKVICEHRFDSDSKLTERITILYDSTQTKSMTQKFERWHPLLGYSSEISVYEYDESGFLVKVIDKNKNGKVFRESFIKNNLKGNPIELKLRENNNFDYGMEKAKYDYENNSVEIQVLDNQENILSKNTVRIDYTIKEKNDIINDFGDLIKYDDYEFDFKYDKFGNWIKQTRYKIAKNRKVKNAEFTRKIKYRK